MTGDERNPHRAHLQRVEEERREQLEGIRPQPAEPDEGASDEESDGGRRDLTSHRVPRALALRVEVVERPRRLHAHGEMEGDEGR